MSFTVVAVVGVPLPRRVLGAATAAFAAATLVACSPDGSVTVYDAAASATAAPPTAEGRIQEPGAAAAASAAQAARLAAEASSASLPAGAATSAAGAHPRPGRNAGNAGNGAGKATTTPRPAPSPQLTPRPAPLPAPQPVRTPVPATVSKELGEWTTSHRTTEDLRWLELLQRLQSRFHRPR